MLIVGCRTYSALWHHPHRFGRRAGILSRSLLTRPASSRISSISAKASSLPNPDRVFGYGTALLPLGSAPPSSIHWTTNFRASLLAARAVGGGTFSAVTCALADLGPASATGGAAGGGMFSAVTCALLELDSVGATGGAAGGSDGNVTVTTPQNGSCKALLHTGEKRLATGLWTRWTASSPTRMDTKLVWLPLRSLAAVSRERTIDREEPYSCKALWLRTREVVIFLYRCQHVWAKASA